MSITDCLVVGIWILSLFNLWSVYVNGRILRDIERRLPK
jgi:hypothetical protein